jgi:hypothetical protein
MGRPTKLTKEVQAELVKMLRAGSYVETACACIGIDKRSFYDWCKKGHAEKKGKHRDFLNAVREATGKAQLEASTEMRLFAKKNWKALAWFMSRRWPDQWAQRDNNAEPPLEEAEDDMALNYSLDGDDSTGDK